MDKGTKAAKKAIESFFLGLGVWPFSKMNFMDIWKNNSKKKPSKLVQLVIIIIPVTSE
jgi:hypothetical protein